MREVYMYSNYTQGQPSHNEFWFSRDGHITHVFLNPSTASQARFARVIDRLIVTDSRSHVLANAVTCHTTYQEPTNVHPDDFEDW